ncbi:hypothetical protein B0T13DRAFT_188164 [Neurospora crassa]|nr:hypothetical protein B0T13DRAFT_188164 [Neurospora crassa]
MTPQLFFFFSYVYIHGAYTLPGWLSSLHQYNLLQYIPALVRSDRQAGKNTRTWVDIICDREFGKLTMKNPCVLLFMAQRKKNAI